MKQNARKVMTEQDERDFKRANYCYLCNDEFDKDNKKLMKVRDHDRRTGCFRGAAHCKCNINFFPIDMFLLFSII